MSQVPNPLFFTAMGAVPPGEGMVVFSEGTVRIGGADSLALECRRCGLKLGSPTGLYVDASQWGNPKVWCYDHVPRWLTLRDAVKRRWWRITRRWR